MFIRRLLTRNDSKESTESSTKWQQKLHSAQIDPDPDLDLADCTIKCLPKGTYSQCLIFRKNRLLLSGNGLSTLPDDDDNRLSDLIDFCTILDISRNQLNNLPPNLGNLLNLRELHLAHNKIKSIPESFVSLRSLETIDLSNNQLNQFPMVLSELKTLKLINISHNQLITRIPSTICNLINLKKLLIDGTNINHPPKRICDEGIDALCKLFKQAKSIDDGSEITGTCSIYQMAHPNKLLDENEKDNIQSYMITKEYRKKRLIEFEKSLLEGIRSTVASDHKTIDKKQEILMKMKQDQRMLHEGLESLFLKKIEDKSNVIKALALLEEHSTQLVNQLNSFTSKIQRQSINDQRDGQLIHSLDDKLRQLMISKDLSKEYLQSELIKEDESLYRAFRNFMDAKDTQNRILSEKISLIEHELHHLTRAEIQRRNNNLDQQMSKLNGQRMALASLLKDLLNEQNKLNHQEGASSLLLMANDQLNLDKDSLKNDPQLNLFIECLDSSLGLHLYVPLFTDCSISLRQFTDASDDQLKSFGIKEEHIPLVRKSLHFLSQSNSPSAPQSTEINSEPSAPPLKLFVLIECVICLDEQSNIILIPCGHVCTCIQCSESLKLCPLCRSEINEKIQSN